MATETRKSILELENADAVRGFFLKGESYCPIELPPYFKFDNLIKDVAEKLKPESLQGKLGELKKHNDVNYTIYSNKDGKYAWRPMELIHPAIYVSLVNIIAKQENWEYIKSKFSEFGKQNHIHCLSLPVVSNSENKNKENKDKEEQITHWWHEIEQRSIELSLDYAYLFETDITDCYGSIYTHSIAWALHTKKEAKNKRKDNTLIGNVIDEHIQAMKYGQTNGIPQGSVLMDFIAEMVLGYADLELSKKIENSKITDCKILRYRDDYRVFVNNPLDGEKILKFLTEVAIDLGLKINSAKTKSSKDVVSASIKSDKLAWLDKLWLDRKHSVGLQKHLLIIHNHAIQYPNSGSIVKALNKFYKRITEKNKSIDPLKPLIAIAVDIAVHNPKTYPVCAAILSKLLNFIKEKSEIIDIIKQIKHRFDYVPNVGLMHVWLQRISYPFDNTIEYEEPLCKLVAEEGKNEKLWNKEDIPEKLKNVIDEKKIIDRDSLKEIKEVIPPEEFELFAEKHDYS